MLISFGNSIDVETNKSVIAIHKKLQHQSFDGFVESVPAYSSLAIFYRYPARFEIVENFLRALSMAEELSKSNELVIELPVFYDGDDLDSLAQLHHLSRGEVIGLHTARSYRVFMLGFLPGFPYMGSVDQRIATPRKNSPRTRVPAGSVGIAGMQTGIYPQTSPGGWQLIGRTPMKVFDVKRATPCLLNPGDEVKFYSIGKDEFEKLNEY